MLKDRQELERKLIKYINGLSDYIGMTEEQKWYLELMNKYNIPISISSDIISQRKDISEYNVFILYAITDIILPKYIPQYFTKQEIKMFADSKYEVQKVEFPLKLHLIKITDEQYIAKTSARFLMQLREQQLINYNAETQRALRVILQGGTKILRPYINDKAVTHIDKCFMDGIFIPNMITLNINYDDENADYTYNEKEEMLYINNISAFDIVDGYHRYLGLSRNYDRDNNWDYPMMIQITTFPLGKARQMIYQENQKTKMQEVSLSTYNQYDIGNIVVNRLNSDPNCDMCGKIDVNEGLINPGILAQAISRLYFDNKSGRKEAIAASKELIIQLNKFVETEMTYMEKQWDVYEILVITYGFYNKYTPERINEALNNISEEQISILNRIKDMSIKVQNIMKEVYGNV